MASIYETELSQAVRHRRFLEKLRKIAGISSKDDNSIGFDYAAFMCERQNCHRNYAIAYYLREKNCLKGSYRI